MGDLLGELQERYALVVSALADEPGVTPPVGGSAGGKKFGANALKVDGKIFAMLANDCFVVKLPKARVDELVELGAGERFDPGHGRIMKEWFVCAPQPQQDWLALAREALAFVGS